MQLLTTPMPKDIVYPIIIGSRKYVINVISTIPVRFSTNPARIICPMRIWPEAYTIALGGVATGNMKPQVAARAAGRISETETERARLQQGDA